MTCQEIYKMIAAHTDYRVSIFICAGNWANTKEGELIAEHVDADFFCHLSGDKVPIDWCLCYDDNSDCIELGFLF